MSTIAPSVRGRSWVFQVTALCIVLGALLALSLKTHRSAMEHGEFPRSTALGEALSAMNKENVRLKNELTDYKNRVESLAKAQATGRRTSDLQRLFEESKAFGGTESVHGPGIVVVLRDSPKSALPGVDEKMMGEYIIHEDDIRKVANELFAAGAEAVSVNQQRLVANSSIRCAGPTVLVNSIPVAAPFVIKAIGKPETLEGALKLPGGPLAGLFLLDMMQITKQTDMTVPAYAGSTRFIYAK